MHEQGKARQRGGISISVWANFLHRVWAAMYFDRAATWIVHRTWRGGLNWNETTPGVWVVWVIVGVKRSIHASWREISNDCCTVRFPAECRGELMDPSLFPRNSTLCIAGRQRRATAPKRQKISFCTPNV
ncbi:unnamed protein product [Phaeothamnion confervicola]